MSATADTPRRLTVVDIARQYADGAKLPMLTAYDFPTAQLLDQAGIPLLLVGDSLGQVLLGYETTVRVTMAEMVHHTKAVVRGSARARCGQWSGSGHTSTHCALHRCCICMRRMSATCRWQAGSRSSSASPTSKRSSAGCARPT